MPAKPVLFSPIPLEAVGWVLQNRQQYVRLARNLYFAYDLARVIHNADARVLDRYVQSRKMVRALILEAARANLVSTSASLRALVPDKIHPSGAAARGDGADNSANGVGDVVVGAGRMVNAIPPASRGAALKGRSAGW
jgi:hypothetical protein